MLGCLLGSPCFGKNTMSVEVPARVSSSQPRSLYWVCICIYIYIGVILWLCWGSIGVIYWGYIADYR